ncbi:Hint domain-containing protein [Algicella marina]|uniref:Hedgehog/Intein (Hint) domain-containing protein n=1 Tax=Algicella marina TaxID=2683284 RepID=A0A6P1T540_9RHOB|nr:Hint domain-containing protein [Algicella marina]QHQ36389.1 hypothetical protein GO499_15000 [Algicella marina]
MSITFDYNDFGTTLDFYADSSFDTLNIVIADSFRYAASFHYDGSFQSGLYATSNPLEGDYIRYQRYEGAPDGTPDAEAARFDTFNFDVPEGWRAEFIDNSVRYPMETIGGATNVFTYYAYTVRLFSEDGFIGSMNVSGRISGEVTPACFTAGSLIATPDGPRPIEDLREGDTVLTRDRGPLPVRWIGQSHQTAETLAQFPELRPVRIAAGALGDHAATLVSPHHRILLKGWQAQALYGEDELLAAACNLINDSTISRAGCEPCTYVHLLFDSHEIVQVDGLWSESFHPAALSKGSVTTAQHDEVVALFPELENPSQWPLARRTAKPTEASVLVTGL